MKKIFLIFMIILATSSCWFSHENESISISNNLSIKTAIPSQTVKGTFLYSVTIAIDSVDMENMTIKTWNGLTAGTHTFTISVPEGENRIIEIIVSREIGDVNYPIYSGIKQVSAYGKTGVSIELLPLFTKNEVDGIISGEYGNIDSDIFEINGNTSSPVSSNFTQVTSEYLLSIYIDNEYQNKRKIIWKEFLSFQTGYNGSEISIYGIKDKSYINIYNPSIDQSYNFLTTPFGLSGYTSSLYDFDNFSNYTLPTFDELLTVLNLYGVSISRDINGTYTSISEIDTFSSTDTISISSVSNKTVSILGFYKGNIYPALKYFYSFSGEFNFNSQLSSIILYPETGNIDNDVVILDSYGINGTNSSISTKNFTLSLPYKFYLTAIGVNKLPFNSTYYDTLKTFSDLYPVKVFDSFNVDALTSFTMKISSGSTFDIFEGKFTETSDFSVISGDTGIFEGITEKGIFIRSVSDVSVSGNNADFNLQFPYNDIDVSYKVYNGTSYNYFKLLVKPNSGFNYCDVELFKNENRKFYRKSSGYSPIEAFLIFKGKKVPLKVYRKLDAEIAFVKSIVPEDGTLLKVYCYNSNDTLGAGKIYVFEDNNIKPLFDFPISITEDSNLVLSVYGTNVKALWNTEGEGFLAGNDTLEHFVINGTYGEVSVLHLLNLTENVKFMVTDYKSGKKRKADLIVNKVGEENVTLNPAAGGYLYLSWNPAWFNGTCSFNIVDSNYQSQNDTWSLDVNNFYYEYSSTVNPDYIYAVEFCNTTGNYTLNYYLYRVQ